MRSVLELRRTETQTRFVRLRDELNEADKLAAGKACVYATGSFGRGEASKHSDLDVFIVGQSNENGRALPRLDEICIEAELIKGIKKLDIPEFSGDGQYLTHYTGRELVDALGRRDDDASNTFTARLLLLLESRPLIGDEVYRQAIDTVVDGYWRDYNNHQGDFSPAFLANDVLRLWRTFCVNYESNTSSEPERERAKRKLKNYKLKHSRLLTCYSALLYLLAIYRMQGTVQPTDAVRMTQLSPTERLEWLLTQSDLAEAHTAVNALLQHYEQFLSATDYSKDELIARILRDEKGEKLFPSANTFGDLMFKALNTIGQGSSFHRALVV
jgi:hypothetical protein